MLEVKNLVKTYKLTDKSKNKEVVALNNVSITFPETGFVFLLGKSGSGKSTLLNAIGGLDTFDKGEIIIKGKSSKSFSQSDFDSYRNTFIGFIFQEYNVLEEFTVAKNLALAIELQGKEASPQKVQELLKMVEMENFAKRKPNQLSGGQKQRVAIARALIKNPEIIMADEPTGALDSRTGKQVMETLKELSKTKLVIIVSHDREFAEIYGDRIIELKDGEIIQDITKKEVEAVKTASGISVIEDEMIHIKKGQKLSKEDMEIIFKAIQKNSDEGDTIISLSERANADMKRANAITDEGNKEVFKNTVPEDIKTKEYDPKKFKLIKSRLKFKDSFKMGASSLKHKKGKLAFTIILSFIAFAMFGLIDTLACFNRPQAVWTTVSTMDSKYVYLLKETKGEYSNRTAVFTQSDIEKMKTDYAGVNVKPVINNSMYFGGIFWPSSDNSRLNISNSSSESLTTDGNILQKAFASGMTWVKDEAELQKLGLSLVAGKLPEADNEVAISKHHFDVIKELNTEKVTEYNSILNTYNRMYTNSGGNDKSFKIVGIIDDGSDLSKYSSITTQQLSEDRDLEEKIEREFCFGFTCMLYVNETYYTKEQNEVQDVSNLTMYSGETELGSLNSSGIYSLKPVYDEYVQQRVQWFQSSLNGYNVVYVNGALKDLSAGQILIRDGVLTTAQRERIGSATNPLTAEVNGKTYTIVGTVDYWKGFCSPSDKDELEALMYGDQWKIDGEDAFTNGELSANFTTLSEDFESSYGSDLNVERYLENNVRLKYLKQGKSLVGENGSLADLTDGEILLSENSLSDIGQNQELYDLIDAGLTITVKTSYDDDAPTLATFTVVGVLQEYGAYISSNDYENIIKKNYSGFAYGIAVLGDNDAENERFIEYCETFSDAGERFTVQNNATALLDAYGEIITTATKYIVWVGVGFAVFAALLLMNFISTSISHKKREIGILRALGARSSDVFGIFFNESLVIAVINTVLASITTIAVGIVVNNLFINKLGIQLALMSVGIRQIVLILGVSVLTAFLSSILPVSKIARKKPIDAINNR